MELENNGKEQREEEWIFLLSLNNETIS